MITPDTIRLKLNSPLLKGMRRAAREEEGAQLVETALTLLVLMGLLLGVIQGSMAVYSYHYLSNAAHEAVRYAIVRGSDWSTSCANYNSSQCTASAQNIKDWVANRGFPGINIAPGDVWVSYFSSPQTSVSTDCSDGSTTALKAGGIVQVTICHPYTFSLPGIGTYTYHLGSTAQMVIAQ